VISSFNPARADPFSGSSSSFFIHSDRLRVGKRTQLETKIMGEKHWAKRSKDSGQFMDQREKGKFKGVRREK